MLSVDSTRIKESTYLQREERGERRKNDPATVVGSSFLVFIRLSLSVSRSFLLLFPASSQCHQNSCRGFDSPSLLSPSLLCSSSSGPSYTQIHRKERERSRGERSSEKCRNCQCNPSPVQQLARHIFLLACD